MSLCRASIKEINQMLEERVQILSLHPEQILRLDADNHDTSSQADQSADLILFYLDAVQLQPLEQCLREFKRILKVQGILLFACTGVEMHTLGDALLKAGFADPVTDRELFEEEVIFAYAWHKAATSYQLENGDIAIPLSQLLIK